MTLTKTAFTSPRHRTIPNELSGFRANQDIPDSDIRDYTPQKKKNKENMYIIQNETDQGHKILEEVSITNKDNKINSISVLLWNCRSFTYEKKALISSRNEDIIIINETWKNKPNVPGYNQSSNIRTNQNGGGVAILAKENLEVKVLDNSVKDTLVTKVLLDRNKYLLVITSYFPCINTTAQWKK